MVLGSKGWVETWVLLQTNFFGKWMETSDRGMLSLGVV